MGINCSFFIGLEKPQDWLVLHLNFLDGLPSSSPIDCGDIVITPLTKLEPFLGAAKMILIVPREDRGTLFL